MALVNAVGMDEKDQQRSGKNQNQQGIAKKHAKGKKGRACNGRILSTGCKGRTSPDATHLMYI